MRKVTSSSVAPTDAALPQPIPSPERGAVHVAGDEGDDLPVTAALLRLGRAVSFATPGHRRGRSCESRP